MKNIQYAMRKSYLFIIMFEADNRVNIYLAHVIYDAGQAEDAANIIRQLVDSKYTFQPEDRMLVINVWLSIINPHRSAILNIKDIPKPCDNIDLAVTQMVDILNQRLDEIISIIKTHILPQLADEEGKAMYYKYLADFERYKLDCVDSSQIPQISSESRAYYVKTIDILKGQQSKYIELLMSTYLNFCILLGDHLNMKDKALETLTQQHHELSVTLEKYPMEIRQRLQDLIDLMAENIQRWKPQQENDA